MPAMIVAEVGVNFDGDKSRIPAFIEYAKQAGADAVKFQAYSTAKLVDRRKITDAKTIDLLKRCELTDADMVLIRDTAQKAGIKHFWSVFDLDQPARCVKFGACALKIGHKESGWAELVKACNNTGVPQWFSGGFNGNVMGTWAYPATSPPMLGNLCQDGYAGYSSHYADWRIPVAAAMRGIDYLECHFKLSDTDPEAAWSLSPKDFATMVKQAREYESWL